MCLRLVFLPTTRLAAWLRLARREETWKTAEILLLRHQLAVLHRQQPGRPRLDWADRALMATLLAVISKARRHGLRLLLVTPDTILRWHRDIIRRRWDARCMRGKAGRPATRRNIRATTATATTHGASSGRPATGGTRQPTAAPASWRSRTPRHGREHQPQHGRQPCPESRSLPHPAGAPS